MPAAERGLPLETAGTSAGATDFRPSSLNQSDGPRMIGHHPMGNLCETRDMEADYKTKISEKNSEHTRRDLRVPRGFSDRGQRSQILLRFPICPATGQWQHRYPNGARSLPYRPRSNCIRNCLIALLVIARENLTSEERSQKFSKGRSAPCAPRQPLGAH